VTIIGKRRSPNHYSTQKGRKVYIQLKSGEGFVDKFMDKKGSFIHVQERGRIPIKDIAVFTHARIDKQ